MNTTAWILERQKIDEELRQAIKEDMEFQKLDKQEQDKQLIRAMLLTGHNLTDL